MLLKETDYLEESSRDETWVFQYDSRKTPFLSTEVEMFHRVSFLFTLNSLHRSPCKVPVILVRL
jgi:hypothetical protein